MSSVFYTITAEVDPALEAEWLDWWSRVHAPEVLAQPGFVKVTIYKADAQPDAWPRYVAMYEVASQQAMDAYLAGEEVKRLRADFQARYGHATRLSRQILTPVKVVE